MACTEQTSGFMPPTDSLRAQHSSARCSMWCPYRCWFSHSYTGLGWDVGRDRTRWVWTPEGFTLSLWKSLLPTWVFPFPTTSSLCPSQWLSASFSACVPLLRRAQETGCHFPSRLNYSSWSKECKTEASSLFKLAGSTWTSMRIMVHLLVHPSVI